MKSWNSGGKKFRQTWTGRGWEQKQNWLKNQLNLSILWTAFAEPSTHLVTFLRTRPREFTNNGWQLTFRARRSLHVKHAIENGRRNRVRRLNSPWARELHRLWTSGNPRVLTNADDRLPLDPFGWV